MTTNSTICFKSVLHCQETTVHVKQTLNSTTQTTKQGKRRENNPVQKAVYSSTKPKFRSFFLVFFHRGAHSHYYYYVVHIYVYDV